VIDVRDWVPRKLAALRCHRTQIGPRNPIAWIDEDEARQWLGHEHFRRSPLDATGDLILEHLGERQHAD
jgi:LmbE family N-acetylglucosaminyl deacetylase